MNEEEKEILDEFDYNISSIMSEFHEIHEINLGLPDVDKLISSQWQFISTVFDLDKLSDELQKHLRNIFYLGWTNGMSTAKNDVEYLKDKVKWMK